MNKHEIRSLSLLTILISMGAPIVLSEATAGPLYTAIEKTFKKDGVYETPSASDVETAAILFSELFTSGAIDTVGWGALGFDIEKIDTFIIVKEKAGYYTGKGVYVFNTANRSPRIIQAPHRPTDLETGRIAAHLIEEGEFMSAALNTVRRDVVPEANSSIAGSIRLRPSGP